MILPEEVFVIGDRRVRVGRSGIGVEDTPDDKVAPLVQCPPFIARVRATTVSPPPEAARGVVPRHVIEVFAWMRGQDPKTQARAYALMWYAYELSGAGVALNTMADLVIVPEWPRTPLLTDADGASRDAASSRVERLSHTAGLRGLRVRKLPTFGPAVLTLALLLPTDTHADPIPVGHLQLSGPMMSGAGLFTLGEERVSVSGSGFVDAGLCYPCAGGTELSLSGSLSDLDGFVAFSSTPFRLPDDLAPGVRWTITMPFTFEARYYPVTGPGPTGFFEGTGTVTGEFFTQRLLTEINGDVVEILPGTFFTFVSATYEAPGEDLAATPEPATLLLFGTSLAGLIAARRRRHPAPPE